MINTSKECTAYSDFPPPKEWPNFAHNTLIMKYLRDYAEHFNLLPHVISVLLCTLCIVVYSCYGSFHVHSVAQIRFGTEVVRVERSPDYALTGRWRVRTRELSSGAESEHTFDAVMIASGHHNRPYVPEFNGVHYSTR